MYTKMSGIKAKVLGIDSKEIKYYKLQENFWQTYRGPVSIDIKLADYPFVLV
jgi:hypothetical protein